METVDVIIGTYGDTQLWAPMVKRAFQSATDQTVHAKKIIAIHGETLAEARNSGAMSAVSDWLIFLDADDELDSGYIEAMLAGSGDIRQPSTLGVVDGREDDYPVLIPRKPSMMIGNHLVIGSMVRREQFLAIGGFNDLPCLEDWDLFIRLMLDADAVDEPCPDAIYRVHVNPESRNSDHGLHGRVYTLVQQRYQEEWFDKFGHGRMR